MQLSRRADYSIRAMVDIASLAPNAIVATREVAERQAIPHVFLTKIVTRLMRAGLLCTHRGATGGIFLARPPHEINMLDIIEAVEGPIALNRCTQEPCACERGDRCTCRPVWVKVQQDMLDTLTGARLSDLASKRQTDPSLS